MNLKPRGKAGMVLVLLLIVMTAMMAIVSAFLYMVSIRTKSAGFNIASSKALWLSEAGLQKYLYLLKTDSSYLATLPVLSESLGSGTYQATASLDTAQGVYILASTGTVGALKRKITQSFKLSFASIEEAMHADGGSIDLTSSSGVINGDLSCDGAVTGENNMLINGSITEAATQISPVIDFAYYKSIAVNLNQTSSLTFQNATFTGVWYTSKTATIGNNAIINGSIIAEGGIAFSSAASGVQITPANNYPALATSKNIVSTGSGSASKRIGLQNSTLNGLIFAGGDITFDYVRNSTFNGTMLSGDDIFMRNGLGIVVNYNADIFVPLTPGLSFSGSSDVNITAQKDWDEVAPDA